MPDMDGLAEGTVITWAGETRVMATSAGVRSVWLPTWTATTQPEDVEAAVITIERGDTSALDHLRQALDELSEFFAGRLRTFTVALDPHGTAFQRRVWAAVAAIPYGETLSYRDVACAIAAPLAIRAVGAANGANPVAPFVPCHRVVGRDGQLTGYGPGLPLKQRLLAMEGAIPISEADYRSWVERTSRRLDTQDWVLGVRATGYYCRPASLHFRRYRMRPNSIMTVAPGIDTGWAPCPNCFPDTYE